MTDVVNTGRADRASDRPTADRSTADLVKQASEQISRLIRDELRLAQMELAEKGKRAGIGAGLFGGAGLISLYGVAVLLAAAVIGLAEAMPAWLAALVVGLALMVLAGVLVLVARGQFRRATPAMPEQAMQSVKADIDAVTEAVKERGQHR
jgi:VIT1/CCC1 family predicted Fe2+/Mn2+ transporter